MERVYQDIVDTITKSIVGIVFDGDKKWKDLTSLGIGNGIPLIAKISDKKTLSDFLKYSNKNNIDTFILGSGSRVVGSDNSFLYIVIKLEGNEFSFLEFENNVMNCGANVSLNQLALYADESFFDGYSKLFGSSRTVGGYLYSNINNDYLAFMKNIISISGMNQDGTLIEISKDRDGGKFEIPKDFIILSVTLKADKNNESGILATQVKAYKNSDSSLKDVFKNPVSGNGARDLIEFSGCSSGKHGGVAICSENENSISKIAEDAIEEDVVALLIDIRERVFLRAGIYLQPDFVFANKKSMNRLLATPGIVNVLVLKGGNSHERPISLLSAEGVINALKEAGYNVKDYDITEPKLTDDILKGIHVVFPVLHGGFGENGEIQAELEKVNMRYVGSNSVSSQIIIDKLKTKQVFLDNEIPTAKYAVLKDGEKAFPSNLSLPVVVKAPSEGSTFGITIVKDIADWDKALENASGDVSGKVLVEEYIDGYEITIPILGETALPLIHIVPACDFYDYDAKYTYKQGKTQYIVPPDHKVIPVDLQDKIKEYAMTAYMATGAEHLARVDALVDKKTLKPYFLELNSIPGFTANSLFPKSAAAYGIPYIQVCGMLIQMAIYRG